MPKSKMFRFEIKCPIYNTSPITAYRNKNCRCDVCTTSTLKYYRDRYNNKHNKYIQSAANYRRTHPDKIKASRERNREYMKNWWITHTYGIKLDDYKKMQVEQSNKCYLCGLTHKNKRKLYLDHDHKTGKIRRLLCCRCNTTIGLVNDDIGLMNKMIDYIDFYR